MSYTSSGWNDNLGYETDAFQQGARWGSRLMYVSPYTGNFTWAASFEYDQEGIDGHALQYALDMTYMPHPSWMLKFNNYYRTGDGWLVANQENQAVQYDRDFFVNTVNITGLVIDNLELSFNLQWALLDAEVDKSYQVAHHQLHLGEGRDSDFSDQRLSSQFKLRYKLGAYSDIYFVYNRNGATYQDGLNHQSYGERFSDLWQQADQDVVTLKLRYLF